MTKWGDRPHWRFGARYLGEDEHGDWIGIPAGTLMTRPGKDFTNRTAQVGLVPREHAWLATFHAPGYHVVTYVDMTSVPTWDGPVVRAVDLDLDVVKTAAGAVYVDDEDEFAEHRTSFGYPPDVVAMAERSRDEVWDAVLAGREPFGVHAERWFDALRRLER
jgi:protein associated with RNAse G/E